MLALAAQFGAAMAAPAAGQTLVDGDTIRLDGTTYRIWGIDAVVKLAFQTIGMCGQVGNV